MGDPKRTIILLGKTGVGKSALINSLSRVLGSEAQAKVGSGNRTETTQLRKYEIAEGRIGDGGKVVVLDTAGLGAGTEPLLHKLFEGDVTDCADMLAAIKQCARNAKRRNEAGTTGSNVLESSKPEEKVDMKPDVVLAVIDATTPFPKHVLKDIPKAVKEANNLALHVIATKVDKLLCSVIEKEEPTVEELKEAWNENEQVKQKIEQLRKEVREIFNNSALLFTANIFESDEDSLYAWKKTFVDNIVEKILDKP